MAINPIYHIVPTEHLRALWMGFNPYIYDKNEEPYGLLSPQVEPESGQLVVYSATKDDQPFTFSMIKDIYKLCDSNVLTHIMTTDAEAAKRIKEKFSGRKFRIDVLNMDEDTLVILVYKRDVKWV